MRWCELKATLYAPPSTSGRLLELARLGILGAIVDPSTGKKYESTRDEFSRNDSANRRAADFAHHEYVMGQFTQLQRRVLIAGVLPIGWCTVDEWAWFADLKPVFTPLYDLENGKCGAPTKRGFACTLPRVFGEPRCWIHAGISSRPLTYVAQDGAELANTLCPAPDPETGWDGRARDLDGEALPDDARRVRVLRAKPVYIDREELAKLLGLTVWEVREAGRTARAQLIERLIKERAA
jgi:hypothetical protein